jgi:hypothetical protein
VQGDRRFDDLDRHVGGGAERAIGVREIAIRMDVNCLNGSARNDEHNTQESQEKFPRTLNLRV